MGGRRSSLDERSSVDCRDKSKHDRVQAVQPWLSTRNLLIIGIALFTIVNLWLGGMWLCGDHLSDLALGAQVPKPAPSTSPTAFNAADVEKALFDTVKQLGTLETLEDDALVKKLISSWRTVQEIANAAAHRVARTRPRTKCPHCYGYGSTPTHEEDVWNLCTSCKGGNREGANPEFHSGWTVDTLDAWNYWVQDRGRSCREHGGIFMFWSTTVAKSDEGSMFSNTKELRDISTAYQRVFEGTLKGLFNDKIRSLLECKECRGTGGLNAYAHKCSNCEGLGTNPVLDMPPEDHWLLKRVW